MHTDGLIGDDAILIIFLEVKLSDYFGEFEFFITALPAGDLLGAFKFPGFFFGVIAGSSSLGSAPGHSEISVSAGQIRIFNGQVENDGLCIRREARSYQCYCHR